MKYSKIILFLIIALILSCKDDTNSKREIPKHLEQNVFIIEKNITKGFYWPYFLYIPEIIKVKNPPILVTINNTKSSDNFTEVYNRGIDKFLENIQIAKDLGIPMIMCALPRFQNVFPSNLYNETDAWIVNVQALTRNSLLTNDPLLERIDLQVKEMISDAKLKLKNQDIEVNDKVIMYGFSASGDFVNRFSIIHPEVVEIIISGDPSDWYTLTIENYNDTNLRYPIGVYDLENITGKKFNKEEYDKIDKFFFTGSDDKHNPLYYIDNIDFEDRIVFQKLFGDDIIAKYKKNIEILKQNGCNVDFKIYDGVEHRFTAEMKVDIKKFIESKIK